MTSVYLDGLKKDTEVLEVETKVKSPSYYFGMALGLFIGLPLVTMLLWNWLMPAIFGLPSIGFFKSAGLLVLSFILVKR